MEFCPECGSMLLPTEDNELKCSCGYTKKLSKDKSEYNVNEKSSLKYEYEEKRQEIQEELQQSEKDFSEKQTELEKTNEIREEMYKNLGNQKN